jgi:hypothetical protein
MCQHVRGHHGSHRHCSANIQRMSLQGFCAAVPEDYLEILNKNTTDIDYIGMCYGLCSIQGPFLIASNPRARRSSQEDIICIICGLWILGCKWQPDTSRECLGYLSPPFVSIILVLRRSPIKSCNTHTVLTSSPQYMCSAHSEP